MARSSARLRPAQALLIAGAPFLLAWALDQWPDGHEVLTVTDYQPACAEAAGVKGRGCWGEATVAGDRRLKSEVPLRPHRIYDVTLRGIAPRIVSAKDVSAQY